MKPKKADCLIALILLLAAVAGCTWSAARPKHVFRTAFDIAPQASAVCTPEFNALMDREGGGALVQGNGARLLTNGHEAFPAMLDAIARARKRISCQTYIIRSDDVGRKVLDALIAAAERGVEVRFVYDDVGGRGFSAPDRKRLSAGGVQCRIFNPIWNWTLARLNNRNHRKILVVDGSTGFVGGLNFANEYDGDGFGGWRDTAAEIRGPAAFELEKVFAASWEQAGAGFVGKDLPIIAFSPLKSWLDMPVRTISGYEPFAPARDGGECDGSVPVRFVSSAPDQTASSILNMYVLAIRSSQRYVAITSGYFVPPIQLSRALVDAAERGVDVRLLLQGQTDEPTVRRISIGYYGKLLGRGVRIYEWDRSVLHAKTAVIDDAWATVGSANLDGRALFLNYEANAEIHDAVFSRRMKVQFDEDCAHAREVTLAEWKSRPVGQRTQEILLYPLEDQF